MRTLLWTVAILAALWLLHRLALWMEARGWIYYVRKKPDPASLGSALLELQQLAEPQKRHVLEVKRGDRSKREAAGGPDKTGH